MTPHRGDRVAVAMLLGAACLGTLGMLGLVAWVAIEVLP
jgi:hypothetical protein